MHTGGGGWRGIKVYPPSEIFAKLVNKNAIKHQKGVASQKNFHNPYIPSLPKFGKNLIDPPPRISNHAHLCFQLHNDVWIAGQSCCETSTGFGCCPTENAVCCGDGLHCCPQGSTCDITTATCIWPQVRQSSLLSPFEILCGKSVFHLKCHFVSFSENNALPNQELPTFLKSGPKSWSENLIGQKI